MDEIRDSSDILQARKQAKKCGKPINISHTTQFLIDIFLSELSSKFWQNKTKFSSYSRKLGKPPPLSYPPLTMSFPTLGAPPPLPLGIPPPTQQVYSNIYFPPRRRVLEFPDFSSQPRTHRYDEMPPPEVNLIPRRTREDLPVIAELMNTVAEAQSRKRQHEQQEYTRRHFGQQTGMDEDTRLSEEPIISQTKRFRPQSTIPLTCPKHKVENGTNTTPPPSEDGPSTSSPPRDPARPSRFNSPSARQARRARRQLRNQLEAQRIVENNQYMQQVTGLVPREQHICEPNCVHRTHTAYNMFNQPTTITIPSLPSAVATNMIPPAVAPIMMDNSYVALAYQQYFNIAPIPHYVHISPPQPPPLAVPIPVRPAYQPYQFQAPSSDYYFVDMGQRRTSMYHNLPSPLERHLFVGIEIDVPIGATRAEIDSNSTMYKYEKKEGDDEACTVCLTDFDTGDDIRKLRCNHMFHPGCIEKWLDINKKCPMCRKEIDKGEGEEPTPPIRLGPQPPPIPQLILN